MTEITEIQKKVLADILDTSTHRPSTLQETADHCNLPRQTVYKSRVRLKNIGLLDDRFMPTEEARNIMNQN